MQKMCFGGIAKCRTRLIWFFNGITSRLHIHSNASLFQPPFLTPSLKRSGLHLFVDTIRFVALIACDAAICQISRKILFACWSLCGHRLILYIEFRWSRESAKTDLDNKEMLKKDDTIITRWNERDANDKQQQFGREKSRKDRKTKRNIKYIWPSLIVNRTSTFRCHWQYSKVWL